VANTYLVHTTRVAARIGRIIGGDAGKKAAAYEADVERLTDAFYKAYVTPSGRIASDTQTALALVTYFDIYPGDEEEKERLRKVFGARLALLVRKDFFRVSTGFAGTPIILMALAKAGHTQVAYRMLQEPTCPSFLSPVLLGATTIWERWDSMLQDGTINP
jgi:alpha-L-rhamnosidase